MQMVGTLVISRARLEDNLRDLYGAIPTAQQRSLEEINQALERQLRDLQASHLLLCTANQRQYLRRSNHRAQSPDRPAPPYPQEPSCLHHTMTTFTHRLFLEIT